MTENTSQMGALPNSLDGKAPLPPAKLEGNPYLNYLTTDEYDEFQDLQDDQGGVGPKYYKFDTPSVRVKKMNRYLELLDKLDLQYISDYYTRKLYAQKLSKQKQHKPNRYELGAREFTFTYSPKWFDDATARMQMSSAIQKLCRYYKDEIIQLRAVGEVGTSGLSHIHCFYKLRGGNKITDKNFKRAWKMWDVRVKQGPTGHQGGHHANVRSEADFHGYIDKDINNSWFEVNIDNSTADPN